MRRSYLLICIFLAMAFGWILGTLRIPEISSKNSFYLGLVSGMVFLLFALILLILVRKNFFLKKDSTKRKTWTVLLPWISVLFFAIAAWYHHLNYKQSKQLSILKERVIQEQSINKALIESERKSKIYLQRLTEVLSSIKRDSTFQNSASLSQGSIAKLIALSEFLEPYEVASGDSLSKKPQSPERRLLLLALLEMKLDSISFEIIKEEATFAYADLHLVNLKNVDLSGIDLSNANLYQANLEGVNFSHSILANANLEEANLEGAIMVKADLKRVNFKWATLKNAKLQNSNLKGADFSDAKLERADLQDAFVQLTVLNGALLKEANLYGADLYAAQLEKANLQGANFNWARIRAAIFTNADLREVNFLNTAPGDKWIEKAETWGVLGLEQIKKHYYLEEDSIQRFKGEKFILKKRKKKKKS